jgi:uncharacterized membrane protein HdeD (DUF308 family)
MQARSRWSTAALVLGGVVFFLASVAGFLNANIVNGPHFAAHIDQMRQDPGLAQAIGDDLVSAVVDAQPDLIAIQPALQAVAATVVSSSAFTPVFTKAVASFHSALTEQGSGSAVLTIADLSSSALSLVEAVAPDLAENIPANLDVTLAQIGGQEGPAAMIIPWFQSITALALLLPVLAVAAWALGIWWAPDRRVAILKVGWSLIAVAAALGVIAALGWVFSRLYDPGGPLQTAVLESAADVFGMALAARVLVTAVVGGLIVVAASALLPQIHVHDEIVRVARAVARRPQRPVWALARALALIAVGAAFVVWPSVAVAVVAVLVGVAVFLIGVAELDLVAERARERRVTDAADAGWRWAWVFPVLAGVVAVSCWRWCCCRQLCRSSSRCRRP